MTPLTELANCHLDWIAGEGGNWDSVLRADGLKIGSLHFERDTRAVGNLQGNTWILECEGSALHPHIVVRESGSSEPVATFTQRWMGGGIVSFANGVQYCWNPSHIWSTTQCFRRESKTATVCVSLGPPAGHGSCVHICPEATDCSETPVLVLLGGFLGVLMLRKLSNSARL